MNIKNEQPSEQSKIVLNALKQASSNELEKKCRLGQYAVHWKNGQVVYKGKEWLNYNFNSL